MRFYDKCLENKTGMIKQCKKKGCNLLFMRMHLAITTYVSKHYSRNLDLQFKYVRINNKWTSKKNAADKWDKRQK